MVEYIEYNEKQYPVRVKYYALTMLKKETGKDVKDIQQGDMELYEPLLFYALEAGAKIQGSELDLKREEMLWVLDQCFDDFIDAVMKFYPPPEDEKKQQAPANRQQRRKQDKA